MKGHLKHLAMCAPMLVIAAVLLVGGASLGALLPVVGCVAMMWLMMRAMGHGEVATPSSDVPCERVDGPIRSTRS